MSDLDRFFTFIIDREVQCCECNKGSYEWGGAAENERSSPGIGATDSHATQAKSKTLDHK